MVAKKKPNRQVFRCGICGVALRGERWVYSSHSKERYCHVSDWNDCAERADKRREKK